MNTTSPAFAFPPIAASSCSMLALVEGPLMRAGSRAGVSARYTMFESGTPNRVRSASIIVVACLW
jgi:hypothetical protein